MSDAALLNRTPSPTATWAELAVEIEPCHPRLTELSPAERVVAAQLWRGLSNKEIAVVLGKSETTVKNQVSACLRKFSVSSRTRLIALLR